MIVKESKGEVLLHPVRMKIVQTLVNGRKLTVQQMGEKLPDVPQASLYRHLKKLVEADLVIIAEENQVRGTVEKVYALPETSQAMAPEEFLSLSKEEHVSYFIKFMATVLADFESYVNQDSFDFLKDGAGYRQAMFYASDEEFKHFLTVLGQEMMKLIQNEPAPGRRRRTMSTIVTAEQQK
ncbi:helix-turn-helix domain-containing protein [Bacillus wudalianchiensis]|uniref:Transcriptional regulator n=1 Tax=Pseudobacillus wudalianchiensis TaxID=1743143 RepID=A0A1B9ATF8_9BACI|nr:transcriptional regulator [Bacillus wudalianchiensis]